MDYYAAKEMSTTDVDGELELSAEFSVEFNSCTYEVAFTKGGKLDSIRKVCDGTSYWEDALYSMPNDVIDVLVHLSTLDFHFERFVH